METAARYLQIVVNVPQASGVFDYHLPAGWPETPQAGCLVEVPFGRQRVQGIVLRTVSEPQVAETRPVEALLDPQPVLTAAQLKLGAWLSYQTLAPLAQCLELMLPPGLSQQADTLYQRIPGAPPPAALSPAQTRLLALLERRGDLRGRQLAAAFPHQNWKASAQALQRHGLIRTRPILLPPGVRPKTARTAALGCAPQEALARLAELGRPGTAAAQRRQAIVEFLAQENKPTSVDWVYAASGGTSADLNRLAEAGILTLGEVEVWRDPLAQQQTAGALPPVDLTAGQANAWEAIRGGILAARNGQAVQPYLLYGVTGSGKTEVYLRAVAETVRQGRQAIILVPEIALTPQTVQRFQSRFPGQVGLVHSRLSEGERFDTWRRARSGQLPIIVGPRSALFAPLPDVGLIVIDECHDHSYYQDDLPPAYNAIAAALEYARLNNSVIVLGSATPGVDLLYRAERSGWRVLRLIERILAHRHVAPEAQDAPHTTQALPPVRLVDMRQELKAGNRSIFSRALQKALAETLQKQQQAILFLNRRGAATYVFCRECGHVLRCPRCELPLTLHDEDAGQTLVCHTCSYRRRMPRTCPECGSAHIRQYGTGTERVEKEVQALFPHARALRWDAETASRKGAHETLMAAFANHQADVLVGTQMLAKGLDLPLVTLVGVVLADVGLGLPDFRAGERCFQLLAQVAGRAGRSPLGGQVVLQTYQPEHYAIRAAAGYDFDGFLAEELGHRRRLNYPPFSRLARLEYRHADAQRAEQAAAALAELLRTWIHQGEHNATELIGPAPCFFSKQNGLYRWQILVRGPDPAAVLRGRPLGEWRLAIDPLDIL